MFAYRITAVLMLLGLLTAPSATAQKGVASQELPQGSATQVLPSGKKKPPAVNPGMGLQPLGSGDGTTASKPRPVYTIPPVSEPQASPVTPPDITPSAFTLLDPASDAHLPASPEEDRSVTFRWRLREAYKPIDERGMPVSPYDKRWRRVKLAQTAYSLCVHADDTCDEADDRRMLTEPTVDYFTDAAWGPDAAGGISREISAQLSLPYADWQGSTLRWSVEACTQYVDQAIDVGAPGRIVGPRCTRSAAQPFHWLIPGPSSTSNGTDERYGDTWHYVFDWADVTGADYYEVCMHPTAEGLEDDCVAADEISQFPAFEEQESNPGYTRFGSPPPGLGDKGDEFWWKVAACAAAVLEVEVDARCTYSAAVQTNWPE